MTSLAIIEHFKIFKDLLSGFLPRSVLTRMNQFPLQSAEEALYAGIIPTIPSP
ncbi:MAG: hypothetical protein OJF50_000450 [Nitrospira sp.]|nr:hypothetical protein [Nitrospira sp.]